LMMRVTQASSNSTVKTSSTSSPSGPSASSPASPRSPLCSDQQKCESSASSTIHHTVMQKKRRIHSSSSISPASNNKRSRRRVFIRSDVTTYLKKNRHSPHFSGGARRDLAPLESAAPKAEMESRVPDDTTLYRTIKTVQNINISSILSAMSKAHMDNALNHSYWYILSNNQPSHCQQREGKDGKFHGGEFHL
jgi:hypothetical protein